MDTFGSYIAKYAPQYNNDKKLRRYRGMLIRILKKFWDTHNDLYIYQHLRICRIMEKKYPDMVVKRWDK